MAPQSCGMRGLGQMQCIALAVLVAAIVPAVYTQAPGTPVVVMGMLKTAVTHETGSIWAVTSASNGETYILPGQPSDAMRARPILPGSRIMLTCVLDAPPADGKSWKVCARVSSVVVVAAAAPYPSTNLVLSHLIIRVSVSAGSCTSSTVSPAVTETDIRNIFFGANGQATYWSQCSFGSLTVDPNTFRVVSVTIPCSSSIMISGCDWEAMGNAADAAAKAIIGLTAWTGLYDRSDFKGKRSYIMPAGMTATCGFGGLAWAPGVQTWLPSDPYNGILSYMTPLHEMVHTFGLHHSRMRSDVDGTMIEYGDSTSVLGNGSVCPSAPEMRRLGWATARADLSMATLPANNAWIRYSIPALASTKTQSFIRIRPNWQTANNHSLYISYRVRTGGDAALSDYWNNKVVVHRVGNIAMDNDAAQAMWGDALNELYRQAAFGGAVLDMSPYRIAVRAVSVWGTIATVDVCRYSISASQCTTGGTASPRPSPSPSRLSPPSPSPPRSSPPPLRSPPPPLRSPPPPLRSPPPPLRSPPPPLRSPPPPLRSPPPPNTDVPVPIRYIGCVSDNTSRVLWERLASTPAMTISACAKLAYGQGMPIFGLQAGWECWGGYSVQRARIVGASNSCNTLCADRTSICGGDWAMSLYEFVTCAGGYLGCFAESLTESNGWAMPGELRYGTNTVMTLNRCQAAARSFNYEYFGLAGGNKCWFGNSLPNAMRFGVRYTCNRPCNGNSNQICGGADLSVYSLYRTDRCEPGQAICSVAECALSYPSFPECMSDPRKDSEGQFGGWCISRIARFSAYAGGVFDSNGSMVAGADTEKQQALATRDAPDWSGVFDRTARGAVP